MMEKWSFPTPVGGGLPSELPLAISWMRPHRLCGLHSPKFSSSSCALVKPDSRAAPTKCHERVWQTRGMPGWGIEEQVRFGKSGRKKKILSRNKYIKYPLVHGCRTQRYHTVQQLFPGPSLVKALKSPFYISCQRSSLSTEFCTFNIQIFPSPQNYLKINSNILGNILGNKPGYNSDFCYPSIKTLAN